MPPSPNDQNHEVGVFVEESIKWTLNGIVPAVTFDTNDATGTEAPVHTGVKIIILNMRRKNHIIEKFLKGLLQLCWWP